MPFMRLAQSSSTDVTLGTPSELNAGYAKGNLDMGAMSSFYFLQSGNLELVPGVSISCTGAVGSVLLFSKVAPERLDGATIKISSSSATSVNLLRILLQEHYGATPQLVADPQPDLNEEGADAALVIGDRALEVDAAWTGQYHRVDLGQWWLQTVELPMVFGLWAARCDWVFNNKKQFDEIAALLLTAKEQGLSNSFENVLNTAQFRTGLTTERLTKYFREELDFDLSEKHLQGLARYRDLAVKHGLLR